MCFDKKEIQLLEDCKFISQGLIIGYHILNKKSSYYLEPDKIIRIKIRPNQINHQVKNSIILMLQF